MRRVIWNAFPIVATTWPKCVCVCDGIALPAVSLCHRVLTNLRFGLPHIILAEELSPMPQSSESSLHFPYREEFGIEALSLYVRFNNLEENSAQRDECMTGLGRRGRA